MTTNMILQLLITFTITCLLHVQLTTSSSYTCPKKLIQCDCKRSTPTEFLFSCPRVSSQRELEYTVRYDEALDQMTLECTSSSLELSANMLDPFHFPSTIRAIRIFSCPSPNVSYAVLLGSFNNVTELQLRLETQPSNASLFHDMNSLVILTIEGSQVEVMHDTMLQDMTALQNLTFSQTNLESIPQGFFNSSSGVLSISLDNNRLSSLPTDTFVNLTKLVQLIFSHNHLTNLSQDIFRNLPQLKELKINNNLLTYLSSATFSNIPNLQYLDLSFNDIRQLPEGLLDDNYNMLKLKLQRNDNLATIPANLLKNLTLLKELHLNHNNLSHLDSNLLQTSTSLEILHLNNNQLKEIPSDFFKYTTNLIEIDLSVNQLASIPFYLFKNLKKLKFLYMRSNLLADVTHNVFSFLPSLNILILSYNKIEVISASAFEGDNNMTALDLSSNSLHLTELPFSLPNRLHFLNLSHNMIMNIPNEWLPTTSLQMLNISYNNIHAINVEQLQFASSYVEIDVRMNQIETVNVIGVDENISTNDSAKKPKHKQVRIFINQNPMKCDCNLLPFIRYLKQRNLQDNAVYHFEADQLQCSSPAGNFYYRTSLTSVVEDMISCEVRDCSFPCTCLQNAVHQSITVNCINKSLRFMPHGLPANVTQIHLDNNSLTSLTMPENSDLKNVTEIYLSQNNLKTIDQFVQLPAKLRLLTLDGNYLESMPDWIIKVANSREDFTLMLGNNPWKCDCTALNLLRLLNSTRPIVNDVNKVHCGPGHLENQKIISLDATTLCPTKNRIAATTPAAVMIVSTLILAFVLIAVTLLLFRNRDRIKLWFYRRRMCLWMRTEDDIEAGHPL